MEFACRNLSVTVIVLVFAALGTTVSATTVTEWEAIDLSSGDLRVPVKVAGRHGKALLESASDHAAVNVALLEDADELGITEGAALRVITPDGREDLPTYNLKAVQVLGASLALNRLIAWSGTDSAPMLRLGSGLFDNNIVQIDYPQSRMRMLGKRAVNLREAANVRAKYQPMRTAGGGGLGYLAIQVGLPGGKKIWVLLSTGFSGALYIERAVAENMGLTETVNGAALFQSLEIGPYTLSDVPVSFPAESDPDLTLTRTSANAESGLTRIKGVTVRGRLGHDVLRNFVVTMDYEEGLFHIAAP